MEVMEDKVLRKSKYPQIEIGNRYGYLEVIGISKIKYEHKYICRCVCGTEKNYPSNSLRNNHSRSCGCKKGELRKIAITERSNGRYKKRYWRETQGI